MGTLRGLKSGTGIKGRQCSLGGVCSGCPAEWSSVVLLPSPYSPFPISHFWSSGSQVAGPTSGYKMGLGGMVRECWKWKFFLDTGKVSAWSDQGPLHTDDPVKETNPGEALPREGRCGTTIDVSGSNWNLIQSDLCAFLLHVSVISFTLSGQLDLDFCLLQPKHF